MIKVLIYEDNIQLREGLSLLIDTSEGFKVVAGFQNCKNIVEDVIAYQPDVILMDIDMPFYSGIDGLKMIRKENSEVKILMLTVFDDNHNVFESIKLGANGYLLKKTPPTKLLEYITDAAGGGAPMTSSIATQVLQMFADNHRKKDDDYNLSDREQTVLQLLVEGHSYKMIASQLFISIDTVRSHIKHVYEKLQVNSKSEAVAKALKDRIV